jgi:glycosyltransferase involved in cell wall biosynthesis
MRVAINAQLITSGHWGGVEQFVLGLVYGLGQLRDGAEEYIIVGPAENTDWLAPYLGTNQTLKCAPRPGLLAPKKEWLGPLRAPAGKMLRWLRYALNRQTDVNDSARAPSDGFYESLGANVVHFPFQLYTPTDVPYIYNPHDLQHLHHPQFFRSEDIAAREASWRPACRDAAAIVTDCVWVRHDVAKRYAVPSEKIFAIPMGAPTTLYGALIDLSAVRQKFDLPSTFAFYPAQTWQHKNHLRLIEAIALLRARDNLIVNLICTGAQNEFYRVVAQRVRELQLETQVRFLGFVEPAELRALYHLAQFVIHPSLFEGGGLPILEAFNEGAPVACANTTSLPEYAGDAALYFDSTSVESIADAAKRMTSDAALRADLRERGHARVQSFTWERTARAYRALYRKIAGQELSADDHALLEQAQK